MYIKYTMGSLVPDGNQYVQSYVEVSETTSVIFTRARGSSEVLTILEASITSLNKNRNAQETVVVSDSSTKSLNRTRFELEEVTLTDSAISWIILPKHGNETVVISDAAVISIYESRGKSKDTVEIGDSSVSYVNYYRTGNETEVISESVVAFFAGQIESLVNETVSIADSVYYNIFQPILISRLETVTVSETTPYFINHFKFITENIQISEAISKYVNTTPITRSLAATVDVIESSATKIKQYKTGSGELINLRHQDITRITSNIRITQLTTNNITRSGDLFKAGVIHTSMYEPIISNNWTAYTRISPLIDMFTLSKNQLQTLPTDGWLDFEFIKDPKDLNFTIISGQPEDCTVTDIIIPGYFGVAVSGIEVGNTLVAGDQIQFVVRAFDGIGRDVVRDAFAIHFSNGQVVKIWVKIIRARVWDLFLAPDRDKYTESIMYDTITFESISNFRKTKPRLTNPKYSVKYTATATHTRKHRAFLNIFRKAFEVPVIHPLWGQAERVISYIENGSVINCNTIGPDFRVGAQVFVFKNADEYIKAYIVSISPSYLVVDRKLTTYVGDIVTPSFTGIAKGTIDTRYTVEGWAKLNIQVDEFEPYV